jgi:hypothetical protein
MRLVLALPRLLLERGRRWISRLPAYARVRRWTLFHEAPSAANGLMTANGRLRRAEILARHGTLLDSLYVHEDCDAHAIS